VISPVTPPNVCCATTVEPDKTRAARIASKRENRDSDDLMEYLKCGPRKKKFPAKVF
jgi:hypothetical protein